MDHRLNEEREAPEKTVDEFIDASAVATALDDCADLADQKGNEVVATKAAEGTATKDGLSQSRRPASPRQTRQSQQSLRSEQSSEDMLMSTRSKKRRPLKEIDEEEDKHSSQG